jgi:rhodanese-related sulfurtransferase
MRTITRSLALTAVPLVALAASGCGVSEERAAARAAVAGDVAAVAGGGSVTLVEVARGRELAVDAAVTVIDVRTPEEFAEGHIEGAQLIDFNAEGFADKIDKLDRAKAYFVYCRSGNRSGQATALMKEMGFARVYDLDGGVVAWSADGAPLVID